VAGLVASRPCFCTTAFHPSFSKESSPDYYSYTLNSWACLFTRKNKINLVQFENKMQHRRKFVCDGDKSHS